MHNVRQHTELGARRHLLLGSLPSVSFCNTKPCFEDPASVPLHHLSYKQFWAFNAASFSIETDSFYSHSSSLAASITCLPQAGPGHHHPAVTIPLFDGTAVAPPDIFRNAQQLPAIKLMPISCPLDQVLRPPFPPSPVQNVLNLKIVAVLNLLNRGSHS
ncbi:hypothetical protein N657DRAFT_235505 [Parathielavia appendiculata]|uniref:Uncharacterized protein n=1 Tax=Parathielavia appendiculata TaxID=2587402 RepID=A0AAN6Z7J3_9PEZI|nr:hypothetical protein N657DRAFT_235505 [Parathielavia appendiculata]